MNRIKFIPISIISGLLFMQACIVDPGPPPNPFDIEDPVDTLIIPVDELDPNSIEGLHAFIFRPTCANSGCHDGTFEPDFRTIESSYNTLVWHPLIKNDPQETYEYRVVPGNLNTSVLWTRLQEDIDGQSGIMPLAVEPGSDWLDKKESHLANIKSWIEGGAKDIFGNPPSTGNLQPSTRGMVAFQAGSTSNPFGREGNNGAIKVPDGLNQIDVWISLTDDQTPANQLSHNKARLSTSMNDFEGLPELSMSIENPITEVGLFGDPVQFFHKLTLNVGGLASGSQHFIRVYVKDNGSSTPTEIPATGSQNYTKVYFSIKIQ